MDRTDAEIIRQVLAGDVEAFGLIVDRHHERCLCTATHLLGDSDEAEDAVQDAFLRAYRHLGSYRERDRFSAWLLRIVVNQCRSRATFAQRWRRYDDSGAMVSLNSDAGPHVDHASVERERRAELVHALSQLDEEQREAVVLRFANELSFGEMSAVTGVGVSALKMRVQRACARLRTLLSEHTHA